MPNVAVVITCGPDRMDNVRDVLAALGRQDRRPDMVVVVLDGHDEIVPDTPLDVVWHPIPKHHPGREQPRNVGVRVALALGEPDYAWFLDSDVIVEPDSLEQLLQALDQGPQDRILVGPYDWMDAGRRSPHPELRNDPRWAMFDNDPGVVFTGQINAGLACFGGNLMWPVREFISVGGFHRDLYHGRCEDGELGLRAVAMGVGISFVGRARGWHLWHPRNDALAIERNRRDVPLLHQWHPWVQGHGVLMVDRDGKAFDKRCSTCGQMVSTLAIWGHEATHAAGR